MPLQVVERIHALQARLADLQIPAKFASDLAVAKALAVAARAGALENVNINLDSIQDAEFKNAVMSAAASVGMKCCANGMPDLAIVHCRQLVTLAGPAGPRSGPAMRDLGIIADGALHVHDGRIAAVGSRAEIERSLPEDIEIVDAGGRIVLPGFVDAHTHPVFAGNRAGEFERRVEGATYAEIAASGGGIRATVRLTREASGDGLLAAGRRYADWFLRGGTTTIEAKSGYGLTLDAEVKILKTIRRLNADARLRYIPTFLGAHEVPDEYRGRIGDYVDLVIHEMLPCVARENLAEFCDVFCEPNVFPVEQARPCCARRRGLDLGLRLHADQFSADYGALLAAELMRHCRPPGIHRPRPGWPPCLCRRASRCCFRASVYTLAPRATRRRAA